MAMPQAMLRNFLSLSVLFHAGLFGSCCSLASTHPPSRTVHAHPADRAAGGACRARARTAGPRGARPRSVPARAWRRLGADATAAGFAAARGRARHPGGADVERPAPAPAPPPAKTPEGRAASGEPRAETAEVKPPAADPRAGTSEQPRESPARSAESREPSAESRVPSPETRETPEAKVPPVTSVESAPAAKAPPQVASVPVLPPVELPRTPLPEPSPETPRPAAPRCLARGLPHDRARAPVNGYLARHCLRPRASAALDSS